MADGTIPFADGLGFKALDSNELRRKQHIQDQSTSSQSHPLQSDLEALRSNIIVDSDLGPVPKVAAPSPSAADFGEFCPKSLKKTSPSRKLQNVFEEALQKEAEERAARLIDTSEQDQVTNQGVYSFTVILLDPSSFHTQRIWYYRSLFKGDQLHMIQIPKHSEQLHSQIYTVAVAVIFQFSSCNVVSITSKYPGCSLHLMQYPTYGDSRQSEQGGPSQESHTSITSIYQLFNLGGSS